MLLTCEGVAVGSDSEKADDKQQQCQTQVDHCMRLLKKLVGSNLQELWWVHSA